MREIGEEMGRIAFRCDGDDRIGAGHVARCLPLAAALTRLGWRTTFVGAYGGLAAWLLARAGADTRTPQDGVACGVGSERCDLAVVDSYAIAPAEICALARRLPVITLAEANRCPDRGVLLDYHLDRDERLEPELLAGPSFAPLDPSFAAAGRADPQVRDILVTVGGSHSARTLPYELAAAATSVFPSARILLAAGPQSETNMGKRGDDPSRVVSLPYPTALVDVVGQIDLAITASGLTAYELACAGVPQLAIAIAPNQRRVLAGLRARSLAPCLDLAGPGDLHRALRGLRDAAVRGRLSERGMSVFDGRGARRAAIALTELFGRDDACGYRREGRGA